MGTEAIALPHDSGTGSAMCRHVHVWPGCHGPGHARYCMHSNGTLHIHCYSLVNFE